MPTDLFLAIAHHLLVFALAAMLVAEAVLLRGDIDASVLGRLAGLDAGYGVSAMLLLVVGLCRVFRSEEHTSELQSLMRISYAVFCLKKNKNKQSVTKLIIATTINN